MSIAEQVLNDYLNPASGTRAAMLDPEHHLQLEMLRSLVIHLEGDLRDEGIDDQTARRVIHRLVYGTPLPDESAAEDRIRLRDEDLARLMRQAPDPAVISDLIGLPPR